VTTAATRPEDDFELVVGLEVHVQLKTSTKAFCACSTDFGDPPNTNVCPVCLGLPGALPVLNDHAVSLAIRASVALGCTVHETSVFARKNYFYPDLPKGYQISQFEQPLATNGGVEITTGAKDHPVRRRIGITRLHLEEDAGKSLHDRFDGATAVDLNRSGVPLIEIVSEPDIRSAAEAGAYLRLLKQILEYEDVSDVSMEEGSLRVDANVSARRAGSSTLGQRTEVKNMNSFSAVERAIDVEFARQCRLLAAGGTIQQQTMLWDATTLQVRPARAKEGSHDYRYFPEPDLPPLVVPAKRVSRAREHLHELPVARRARFVSEYQLGEYDVEVLTASPALADYFEGVARQHGDAKASANWVMGEVLAALKASGKDARTFAVRPADVAELLNMVRDGIVTRTAAKQIFLVMVAKGGTPMDVAARENLLAVSDDAALRRWLDEALADNRREAERYAAGEKKLQGVLIGAAMKKSNGSADPKKLAQLLVERFGM
jgi:aspartyl-tRNA(Asn)/glutamyl-tRNA(Gln) amidotransferase subunit B